MTDRLGAWLLQTATPDSYCSRHGYPLHAFVHEAGHAVIAVHYGLSFGTVSVTSELGPSDPSLGGTVAGGLDMGRQPWEWVPEDPVRALEMLVAGMAAESALLGDELPEGYVGDIRVWRKGTGLTDALSSSEEATAAYMLSLGELPGETVTRARALVRSQLDQIARVAMAIHGSPGWTLDQAAVLAVL